jgi:hypothetical protein
MDLLTLLIIVLILAWVTGAFVVPVGGALIHVLLVVLVIVVLVKLLRGQPL